MTAAFTTGQKEAGTKFRLYLLLLLYIAFSLLLLAKHELWADELHSWNIARDSNSFADLLRNMRYEGHPPAWLALLWGISRFTRDPLAMQWAQWLIAVSVVYLLLFHSRLPLLVKALLPFGYYFVFEYAVLSRNYGLGVLLGFLLCIVLHREFRYKTLCYYLLLFLMSNVHLLALLLAGSLHLYYLMQRMEKGAGRRSVWLHLFLGAVVFLPAAWFIAAPGGSGSTVALLLHKMGRSQLAITAQAPLRAFVPVPAWWQYHCWNTQFLLELQQHHRWLRFLTPLLSLLLLVRAGYILKGNKKSLLLFIANTIISCLIGLVFTLHTERYAGYLFIGFVMACWLYYEEMPAEKRQQPVLVILLGIQLLSGLFMAAKDIALPFAQLSRVKELIACVPPGQPVVTDYRAVNAVSAYLEKPLYCLDLRKTISFIQWNPDMELLNRYPDRYRSGTDIFFQEKGGATVYMISSGSLHDLQLTDRSLFSVYHVALIAGFPEPVDRESNLFLYKITRR